MPRVGLDLRSLASVQKSGVENYIRDLAVGLPKAGAGISYYYYVDARVPESKLQPLRQPNVKIIRIPTRRQKLYTLALRVLTVLHRLDLFHFPLSLIPRNFPVPSIITVYDLTYERYPEFYPPFVLQLQKTMVPDSARRAKSVLTISEATKLDLVRYYHLPEDKIHVVYPNVRTDLPKSELPRPFAFKYVLCVGNVQPRKNLPNAIRAFAKLKNSKLHLVIVGKPQDESEVAIVDKLVQELRLQQRVTITGYISEKRLGALYQHCEFVLFPSYYEGYGYPILEAFESRKAIVTGNISSMPEIAQDAAVLVDPASPDAISYGMEQLIGNPSLKAKIVKLGSARLKQLQSRSCAAETAALYQNSIG